MTFTVTYRAGNGRRRTETVEASSRADVFRMMKSRGVNPLVVREGAVEGAASGSLGGGSRALRTALIAVALIALALVGAWRLLSKSDAAISDEPVPEKVRKVKAMPVAKPSAVKSTSPSNRSGPKRQEVARVQPKASADGVPPSKAPAADTAEMSTNAPPALTPEEMLAEAKRRMKFKTAEEQLLSMVTPDEPGGEVPPVPITGEEEDTAATEKGVANVLKPEKDDDEHMLQRKMDIVEMKLEYAELKKQGWTFAQYVKALAAKRNEDAADMGEARRVLDELYRDSTVSDTEYAAAKKQINDSLAEKGLPMVEPDAEKEGNAENAAAGQSGMAEQEQSEEQTSGKEKEKEK